MNLVYGIKINKKVGYIFLDALDEAIIQSKQNVNNILDSLSTIDGVFLLEKY
ncbi:hypothetical protein [Lysinibacillus sp. NPDC093692]|uniref:hypothetical protein n=1 Tax=Lysinibacillus sp. NPDC093692 TaxID=3390578 RepID=UPI003CFFC24B